MSWQHSPHRRGALLVLSLRQSYLHQNLSAPVTVTATPKFAFRLGAATRQAAYESGSDSAALVFARTVQAGEVDRNGISWNALALALDGGTITQTGATTAASLTHAEQANLEGHRVDAAPPMQVSASVHGMSLVLVYDEPLDPASMPATGAYTVTATVGATTTNPAVSEVSIYGIWVTLALDAAPAAGATVTLAYAPPASNPVQDEAGNDAPAFSGQSVRLGPPPPPPDLAQVTGVGVVPGNAQLVVTWTAVSTATGYTVQWKSGGQGYNTTNRQATVTSGTTTSHTITGLANGTEYTVQVSATRTGANDGPPSAEETGTPTVPTAAGITVSTTALTVTEEDSTGDGYTVVLDSQPTANVTVTVAGHAGTDVTPSPTSLTFTSTTWGTAQTVTVTAGHDADTANDAVSLTHSAASTDTDYDGISIAGVAVTVNDNDTAQVLGVSVTPGNAQLVVTWTAVDNATGYTVQWTSGGQAYNTGDRQATVTSGSTTRYTIPSLTNGTPYTVRVIATRTSANDGPPSSEVMGTPFTTPPPPPVTDLAQVMGVTVAPGNAQLVVTWTAVDNATGYTVQWKSGGQGYNTTNRQATVTSGTTTSHTITGLANGTEYTVRVSATRTGANDGPPSAEVTGTPAVPTAAGITVSTAALTVTEQDSTGDGYTVVLDTEPTADVVVTVAGHVGTDVTPSPTSLTFTMSNWETAQTVTVTADDDADTTDDSVALTHSAASADSGYDGITIAGVAVTVTDNDTAQVMGVGVTPGNAQLVVTWTAVDNATGYTVQWTSGSQAYNTGDRQATVTSGSTTRYTIPSLTNGTPYTVRVIATRTAAGDGPCAGDGGNGRPGQRAAGGDLDGSGQRHGLHSAVEVGRPGLQHHQPAGHGHFGYDDALHDSQPHQRHPLHGAGDCDPDGRQRWPAVGGGDSFARHHARRAAAPECGAGLRTGDADLGCPVERWWVRDPPVRGCGRRQRDLDRRGPRSGGNGHRPDQRAAVHLRGAGGERGRHRPGGGGDDCVLPSAAAGVAGAVRTRRHGPCRGCGFQPLARRAAGLAPDHRGGADRGTVWMDRERRTGRAGHGRGPG